MGEQPAVVAERYGIDRDTVKSWKRRYVAPEVATMHPVASPAARPKFAAQQIAIGSIILDLLRSKLEASQAIAETAKDAAWRTRQSAAELAVFGQWLDESTLALGDRLAGHRPAPSDDPDPDEAFSPPT
jgi:transposase